MDQTKKGWRNKEDVLASLDQVSTFTKGQPRVAKIKIHSERSEEKMRYKEVKRMEMELLEKEKERREREEDLLREDMLLEAELKNQYRWNSCVPRVGRGRAQVIQDMKKKLVGLSAQENENYIREQVRKSTGYYGNDLIEKYWNKGEETTEKTSVSASIENSIASSDVEERLSPEPVENQFDDASSSLDSELVNTKDMNKDFPAIASKPPRCRNALINALQKRLDLSSAESKNVQEEAAAELRVYASAENPACSSKFTYPSLYNSSFKSQWAPKNRKLKPLVTDNEFIESKEFLLNKDDFPPL